MDKSRDRFVRFPCGNEAHAQVFDDDANMRRLLGLSSLLLARRDGEVFYVCARGPLLWRTREGKAVRDHRRLLWGRTCTCGFISSDDQRLCRPLEIAGTFSRVRRAWKPCRYAAHPECRAVSASSSIGPVAPSALCRNLIHNLLCERVVRKARDVLDSASLTSRE